MRLGVSISTHNRPAILALCLRMLARFADGVAAVVVVDDHSRVPISTVAAGTLPVQVIRHDSQRGIAATKNTGLRALAAAGCDAFVLLDDDCFPWRADWGALLETAHVQSRCHHLLFAASDWVRRGQGGDKETGREWYEHVHVGVSGRSGATGQMLFLTRTVLDRVGYFRPYPGPYGFEHIGYTSRIVRSGLCRTFTPYPYVLVASGDRDLFWSLDQTGLPDGEPLVDWTPALSESEKHASIAKNVPMCSAEQRTLPVYYDGEGA